MNMSCIKKLDSEITSLEFGLRVIENRIETTRKKSFDKYKNRLYKPETRWGCWKTTEINEEIDTVETKTVAPLQEEEYYNTLERKVTDGYHSFHSNVEIARKQLFEEEENEKRLRHSRAMSEAREIRRQLADTRYQRWLQRCQYKRFVSTIAVLVIISSVCADLKLQHDARVSFLSTEDLPTSEIELRLLDFDIEEHQIKIRYHSLLQRQEAKRIERKI